MFRSWFAVFIFLAIAILLTYWQQFYLAFLLIALLLAFALYNQKYSSFAITGLIVFISGILYSHLVIIEYPSNIPIINNVTVTGKVVDFPKCDNRQISFVLRTQEKGILHKQLQVCGYFPGDIRKGDMLILKGDLKPPQRPGNPGEFDYPAYLAHNHIYYILTVKNKNDIELVSRDNKINNLINTYRLEGEKCFNTILSSQQAEILLGMLLGKKEDIDAEQYSGFQKVGIVHLFAVSGLHVGFLLLLSVWICSLFSLSPRVKFFCGLCLMFIYGSIVGWPVSVIRATLMASLGLLAHYTGRENALLNSLGIAGTIILLIDPLALFKISFQLSFAATWGLIYLFPIIKARIHYQSRLGDLILIPFCAQIAVIPLIAYHFNLFTPISIVSNILVTYLAGFGVMLGFAAFMFLPVSSLLASFFLYPAGIVIDFILAISNYLLHLPLSFFYVATPSSILIIVYYSGLLILSFFLCDFFKKQLFLVAGILLMLVFVVIISLPAGIYKRGLMEITFIDVGQGDSVLIKSPQGKFMLIDGGGSDFSDIGSRKVLPYLHHRGIRRLLMVINTHPDTDHLAGLEKVVAELKVDYIGIPFSLFEVDRYESLRELANGKDIPLLPISAGQKINAGKSLAINVLHPSKEQYQGNDYNDQSVVLQGVYRDFSFLLTGDLEIKGLQILMQNQAIRPITLLKVPHHGSKNSFLQEFYDEIQPLIAVICVGKNNFGHPHAQVLDCLADLEVMTLQTYTSGLITVTTGGYEMEIETFLENQRYYPEAKYP